MKQTDWKIQTCMHAGLDLTQNVNVKKCLDGVSVGEGQVGFIHPYQDEEFRYVPALDVM